MRRVLVAPPLLLACALVPSSGCAEEPAVHAIESTRVVLGDGPTRAASSALRFGGGGFGAPGALPAEAAGARGGGLGWTLPEGWEELPPAPPRVGSFRIPGGVDGSLTTLPGSAGGVAANVDRWRGQMGLPPADAASLAALPRLPVLGGSAVLVDLLGSYSGMGDDELEEQARMLALILEHEGRTIFVKLVGPAEAVAAQRDALRAFAASLHVEQDAPAGADPHAGVEGAPPLGADPHAGVEGAPPLGADPHAGVEGAPPLAGDPHAGGVAPGMGALPGAGGDALGLAWTVPEGWRTAPPRPMRSVTLVPDVAPDDQPAGADEVELYVVVLGGDGGGTLANVNLWRQQMGRDPWTALELDAAARVEVLGSSAVRVHVDGAGDAAGRALLGVICPLGEQTVFVKAVGPRGALAALAADFDGFCRSLER